MWRRHTALFGILACLVIGFAVVELQLKEPGYRGRRLSGWLAQLDLESSRSSQEAVYAIQAIGTNAFPTLVRMIQSTDPWWKRRTLALNARQPFFRVPVTPSIVFRNRAVQAYSALGPRAKENIPELVRLLETESSCEVRSSAAAALGAIGPKAESAIPALFRATHDQSAEVRRESLWALANIRMVDPGR
jgi:HEAT repeat protein